MVFGSFGDGIYLVALHHIAWHLELCREPMVATVPVQHRHNDAASYLVGYEGRRHGICIAYALRIWIMVYWHLELCRRLIAATVLV